MNFCEACLLDFDFQGVKCFILNRSDTAALKNNKLIGWYVRQSEEEPGKVSRTCIHHIMNIMLMSFGGDVTDVVSMLSTGVGGEGGRGC